MSKFTEIFKVFGFTFSLRRLKKAIVVALLFILIGIVVSLFYEFKNSELGLKVVYTSEIAKYYDLEDNTVINVYKKNVIGDSKSDFVYIIGEAQRTSDSTLNSVVNMYLNVAFVIIDGSTNEVIQYDLEKDFDSNVKFEIYETQDNTYYMIADYSGNLALLLIDDSETETNITDIVKNTVDSDFLGFTIYSVTDSDNNTLQVTLDSYGKSYLNNYSTTTTLDFNTVSDSVSNYRETYLRDKFCKFELSDIDDDGTLELLAYQYVLYSINDSTKYAGIITTTFNISNKKFEFKEVDIQI